MIRLLKSNNKLTKKNKKNLLDIKKKKKDWLKPVIRKPVIFY